MADEPRFLGAAPPPRVDVTLTPIGRHAAAVDALVASPDGRWLLSAGRDGRVVRWDPVRPGEGVTIAAMDPARPGSLHRLACGPAGLVAIGGTHGRLLLADWKRPGPPRAGRELGGAITAVAWGRELAVAGGDPQQLEILDASTLAPRWTGRTHKWTYALAFSRDGERLAAGAWNGHLHVVSLAALPPPGDYLEPERASDRLFFAVAWLPDDRLVAAGLGGMHVLRPGADGWDATRTIAADDGLHAVAVSPDGRWLAAGGNDAAIWIGDATLRTHLRRELGGPRLAQRAADDEEFARRLRRFGVQVDGFPGAQPPTRADDRYYPAVVEYYEASGPGAVHALAFSPDGAVLYVGTQGGDVLALRGF